MTQEELTLARKSQASQHDVNVGLTSTALLPANPRRVALIVQTPLTNRVTLCFGKAAILDSGITMYPGQYPLTLSLDQYGAAVMMDVSAISAVAAQNISVVEVVAPL